MKKKLFVIIPLFLVLLLGVMIVFSPYGYRSDFGRKAIVVKTKINTSPSFVYDYLGNSDNAEDWSVFVDHITPLNTDKFQDGSVGASRRCFKAKNEQGIYWDETILINEKNKRRRLNIYDMHGFSLQAEGLLTEQVYKEVEGRCELQFALFYEEGRSSWLDELKMYYAAYFIESIFEGNLATVKAINEKSIVQK